MRSGEAKELAGMLSVVAVLVTMGLGVSSMTSDISNFVDVDAPVEAPLDDLEGPILLAPADEGPAVFGIYEVTNSPEPADPAPELPVGVSVGV